MAADSVGYLDSRPARHYCAMACSEQMLTMGPHRRITEAMDNPAEEAMVRPTRTNKTAVATTRALETRMPSKELIHMLSSRLHHSLHTEEDEHNNPGHSKEGTTTDPAEAELRLLLSAALHTVQIHRALGMFPR